MRVIRGSLVTDRAIISLHPHSSGSIPNGYHALGLCSAGGPVCREEHAHLLWWLAYAWLNDMRAAEIVAAALSCLHVPQCTAWGLSVNMRDHVIIQSSSVSFSCNVPWWPRQGQVAGECRARTCQGARL